MRILHTSDWHLGADYFLRPRHEEQRRFLEWLLVALEARAVDLLVVAGDVFDSAQPSAEAQALYYDFLARLGRAGRTTAVIVGGNHDSPARLEAPRAVLSALSTHVVGGFLAERTGEQDGDPAGRLVPVRGAGGAAAVVAAVPFLHDWRLGVRSLDAGPQELRRALHESFREVYARLADRAAALYPGLPVIATGHLTCLPNAGQMPTEEDAVPEPINRVGTIGALGPEIFDPRFAYVALGHIHRRLGLGAERRIAYSGTPVQVGAAEPADGRRVLLVELDPLGGPPRVEALPVPPTRRLTRLGGPREAVLAHLAALTWAEAELPPYVVAEVVLDAPDPALRDALAAKAPSGPGGKAQVVDLRTRARAAAAPPPAYGPDDRLSPEDAFLYAWRTQHPGTPVPDGVMQRFRSLLEPTAGDDR